MQRISKTLLLLVPFAVWDCGVTTSAVHTEERHVDNDNDTADEGGGGNGADVEGVQSGSGSNENGEGGEEGEGGVTEKARWRFLIFMNGDGDLEHYVTEDFNYLEGVGSGDGVHLIVQADRHPGYVTDDGNWTSTRRYYITKDDDENSVSSEVLEDLGELDMGAPQTLADFLLWAHDEYPAEHTALVVWNHGDSWSSISSDETSGNSLGVANGELNQGLEEYVRRAGPLDVIAFDACLMASWEVAHSLQGYAQYINASEAEAFDIGIPTAEAVDLLRRDPGVDGGALADMMASLSGELGERTYSSIDVGALGELTHSVDELARAVLADDDLVGPLLEARDNARGVLDGWNNWYLDLNDLGAQLSNSSNATLRGHGEAIQRGVAAAVIGAYGNDGYGWTGGLSIMFDTDYPDDLEIYTNGAGATWAQQTAWDDLLRSLASR